jgi:hypothetical protein
MRTTIDIDDDLMRILKEQALEEGTSLTDTINTCLQRQLKQGKEKPFVQAVYPMGLYPAQSLVKALDLAAELETEYAVHKMEIGK